MGGEEREGGRRGGKAEARAWDRGWGGVVKISGSERTPGVDPQDGGPRLVGHFRVAPRSRTGGHRWAGTGWPSAGVC